MYCCQHAWCGQRPTQVYHRKVALRQELELPEAAPPEFRVGGGWGWCWMGGAAACSTASVGLRLLSLVAPCVCQLAGVLGLALWGVESDGSWQGALSAGVLCVEPPGLHSHRGVNAGGLHSG